MTRACLPLVVFFLLVGGGVSEAQVVTAPTEATFAHPDADYAITATYRLEFFQCTSVTGGTCQGRAAQPFQAGTDVDKSQVTGSATTRTLSLTAAPLSGVLPALPSGVPFVATVVAVGDPGAGGTGTSARSNDSNPFFPTGRIPAAPSQTRVQ